MINVASGRTPGPWRFDGNRRFIEAEVDGQFVKVLIAAHGCSGDTWVEVSDANAHLIAAAPDLYDAVAKALLWITDPTADQLEQWERIASEFHNDTGYLRQGKDYPIGVPEPYDLHSVWQEWTYTRHTAMLNNLKAALAKARGEK